jgi:DNA-binding MarR family transcriptional regulator
VATTTDSKGPADPERPAVPKGPTDLTGRSDPTEESRWRPFLRLIREIDNDIGRIYEERGVTGVTPRQVLPLVRIAHRGPMTITELSSELGVTHSAASQTVAALSRAGYVRSKPGADARTRTIALTPRGRALIPLLEAEWRATGAAISDIEKEMPYPLSRVGVDLAAILARRSFYERVSAHLTDDAP